MQAGPLETASVRPGRAVMFHSHRSPDYGDDVVCCIGQNLRSRPRIVYIHTWQEPQTQTGVRGTCEGFCSRELGSHSGLNDCSWRIPARSTCEGQHILSLRFLFEEKLPRWTLCFHTETVDLFTGSHNSCTRPIYRRLDNVPSLFKFAEGVSGIAIRTSSHWITPWVDGPWFRCRRRISSIVL